MSAIDDSLQETYEAFIARIRTENREKINQLANQFGWDLDENGEPLPPWKEFKLTDFPDNALMAHVMHHVGLFKSISDARKNGWNKPIEKGEWVLTKKKIRVRVI